LLSLLFVLSLPGVFVAMPRLIRFLLRHVDNVPTNKISTLAIFQSIFMVSILIVSGVILSPKTGLNAPLLEALLAGQMILGQFLHGLLPTFLIMLLGALLFFILYYGLFTHIIDKKSYEIMKQFRQSLGLDGLVLYGGIVEELLGRWGILNLTAFFFMIIIGDFKGVAVYFAIVLSSLFFALGQLPAYIAAGCSKKSLSLFAIVVLNCSLSSVFGYIFWQYGLLAAICAHVMFHTLWWFYD
jgi:hypothetical protein